ncbi:hypothetical protein P43SY_008875 [Pythium insidiosum]|uniref:Uncharacterized protein n=1 Tax=Pythium insidiosum TaxID=114742 RepID=A0AAD5LMU9_PYTIN|nr:hypothetical protein P43SY_008875 [Pythium insidiosum]
MDRSTGEAAAQGVEIGQGSDADETRATWRAWLGKKVVQLQHGVDANLSLVRVGCLVLMVGSAAAAVRFSGLRQLHQFKHVDDIPSHFFLRQKTIRVRMVRQSERDPSVFYVYHTPFLRRLLLQDTLPRVGVAGGVQPLIAVRAFGIRVDEGAQEWLWSNVVSLHRPLKLTLLHRLEGVVDGEETVATCFMKIQKLPFDRDLAQELVSRGLAESIPETLSKYDTER